MMNIIDVYSKLNNILNIFKDDIKDISNEEISNRINTLIDNYIVEMNNYKSQIEETTMILQAQFEEISRTYEELTTILDVSKLIFSVKDPRLTIDKIVNRLKDIVDFENIVIGEFNNSELNLSFRPLFLELTTTGFDTIPNLINHFYEEKNFKTILSETDPLNKSEKSILLIPIKSDVKIWGFVLLYGKKDNSFFLASDKKIMESITEQLSFGFDTMDYLNDRIKQEKISNQLKFAKQIQESLLPHEIPKLEKIESAAFYRSAYDVGGDYYDLIKLDEDRLFGILADVSGKGVPAALIMSSVKAVLKSRIEKSESIEELAIYLNHYLSQNIPDDTFVTAIFILLNSKEKSVKIINAGHNNTPIFIDGEYKVSKASGLPLGIIEENPLIVESYNYKDSFLFVTYTDGITEARNGAGNEFEYERLEKLIKQKTQENVDVIVKSIIEAVDDFVKEAPQHDDTTLLAIKSY